MRWLWVDRFDEFVSGSHAVGVKNVALDQDVVDEYCRGYPMFPPTLIIEGLAQVGGILVHEIFDFEKRVVLAKVGTAKFHQSVRPGDSLQYRAEIGHVQDSGATVTGTSRLGGDLQAEMELMFAFLEPGQFVEGSLFEPGDLKTMLRLMNFFHVAVKPDGQRIHLSPKL